MAKCILNTLCIGNFSKGLTSKGSRSSGPHTATPTVAFLPVTMVSICSFNSGDWAETTHELKLNISRAVVVKTPFAMTFIRLSLLFLWVIQKAATAAFVHSVLFVIRSVCRFQGCAFHEPELWVVLIWAPDNYAQLLAVPSVAADNCVQPVVAPSAAVDNCVQPVVVLYEVAGNYVLPVVVQPEAFGNSFLPAVVQHEAFGNYAQGDSLQPVAAATDALLYLAQV
uniref:Uncharacterized protein n=1 Tax=Aeromonas allosaccharophila TaxID=656 RepID=E9L0D6_9GAMM|nr:hypothetical protein [Aeromonas allosaccharophila]